MENRKLKLTHGTKFLHIFVSIIITFKQHTMFFAEINLQILAALTAVVSESRRVLLGNFSTNSALVQVAALEFDQAVGQDGASIQVGSSIIGLAGILSKADLTEADKAQIKETVFGVIELPDGNAEQKAENLFGALIELIDTVKKLAADENAVIPPSE